MNEELLAALQKLGINPSALQAAGGAAPRGVFMGYTEQVQVKTRAGQPDVPVRGAKPTNVKVPKYESADQVVSYYYRPDAMGSQLRSKYSYSQWQQLVQISEEQTKYGFDMSPFDVAAMLSAGGGAGTAPVLTQADAETSTQNVYRQALGRDAKASELAAGSRKMRSVYGARNSMASAGEAVLQTVRGTDEYQAELGDDVLEALYSQLTSDIRRTR